MNEFPEEFSRPRFKEKLRASSPNQNFLKVSKIKLNSKE